jgi:predicted acetyltransferase
MTTTPHLEVIPATPEQAPILANLIELYAHDFSEFLPIDVAEDGRFGYPTLPLYWSDPGRHPLLIRIDGKLAGFAFIKRGSEVFDNGAVWDMAEFFILRRYRRHGTGTKAAHTLWALFPGPWEVRVMQANVAAQPFWTKAIASFAGAAIAPVRIEKGEQRLFLFSFISGESPKKGPTASP